MPNYTVKVTFTYPVSAVNAEDALSTVPQVIRMRYIGVHAEGLADILDATGKSVLTAKLTYPEDDLRTEKELEDLRAMRDTYPYR